MWWAHVRGALGYATRPGEATFVAFSDLLERPAESCRRLAEWLGIEADEQRVAAFAEDFIEPALAQGGGPAPFGESHPARKAFAMLREAAARGADPHAFASADEWRNFAAAVDAESLPLLRTVDAFYRGDEQLDLADRRITHLSRSLAAAERLATERLGELASHDEQERRTAAALATAERLANERLAELGNRDDRERRTSAALAMAERWSGERLEECRRLADALAVAERLAVERLEECRRLTDALAHAERVAHAHQSEAAALGERLRAVAAPVAEAARLAAEGGA
jgi:hypothetical protein